MSNLNEIDGNTSPEDETKRIPRPKKGLLVEDRDVVEVHTKDGDRLVKTPDRKKTIKELEESETKPIHPNTILND